MSDNNFRNVCKKYFHPATCVICESKNKVQYHHIFKYKDYPIFKYNVFNILPLCPQCHFVHGHNSNWIQQNINVYDLVKPTWKFFLFHKNKYELLLSYYSQLK